MEVIYRNLRPDEAESFWELMNHLDYETKFMLYEPGERKKTSQSLALLQSKIESSVTGDDLLLAAECGGELAGYLWADKGKLNRTRHSAYIVLGIRQAHRGKGIGTAFFQHLDQWAKEKQISRLELTVMCTNPIAKHLYEKNGFFIEGIKKQSILVDGEFVDEYYMAKLLTP